MKENEKNLYRFVNAFLLMACTFWGMGEYIGISRISWWHFLAGSIVAMLLTAWCRADLRGRVVLVLAVVVAFVATNFVLGGSETQIHIQKYVRGVLGTGGETAYWGRPQECIQAAVTAAVCFGVSLLAEQVFVLRVGVAAALIVVLAVDLSGDCNLSHMGVVCMLLYVAIVYVEWSERGWKKERLANNRHYMVRILPFLVLYGVLMAVMPAPEKPYDWQFVKDAYEEVREVFLQASRNWFQGDREDFAFGNSGFSGNGRLLGGLSDENKTLMIIQGQASLKTNVYLMGKVYDCFDGDSWESTDESDINDRQLDALETMYAVRNYNEEGEAKYFARTGLRIWYEDFRTGYLFAPLKTIKLQDIEETDYTSVGSNYLFHEKQGYGLEYVTSFMQLNVDHPLFYEFLEEEITADGEAFEELQREYLRKSEYTLTDLDNHRKDIQKKYKNTCELSADVQEWLADKTDNAQTDIDKLKAIEAALQQMVYTKTPGELPAWVDSEGEFLDYFLLESKQGYCVYYATAFVLLARAEGLPARYVEGFCVPVTGTQKTHVTSDMAHAWPEVYIENVGWIPFEPTPGYSEIRYTPWEIQTDNNGKGSGLAGVSGDADSEEITMEEESVAEQEEMSAEGTNADNLFKIAGLTLAFVLVAGIVILGADRMLRRRRAKRYSREERFKSEIDLNMRMLAALGYERGDNETLSELRMRAWAIMDGEESESKPEFLFLKFYEEYLYGQYPVQKEMLEILAMEKQYLLQMLKRWKPVLYLYFRFSF